MTVATVRALVNDKAMFDSVTAEGDGTTVRFNLPQFPVVASSYYVYVAGSLQTETTHYALDKDLGLVTFVTAPSNGAVVRIEYQHVILSDADITAFLTLWDNDDVRAAETWCNTVASQQQLLLKVTKILDVEVDGSKVAEMIMELGKKFRDQRLRDWAVTGYL